MSKKRLPQYNLKIKASAKLNGWEYGFYRDKIGNVSIAKWTLGVGFSDEATLNPQEVKKLRDWLTKILEYWDR